jgi:hypothetical protein
MRTRACRTALVLAAASFAAAGCAKVSYSTETKLWVNQVSNLWQDANYRYVATGLMASAHAEAGSAESRNVGRLAMDELVTKAHLKANQALVDVTIEQGWVLKGGKATRVVTLRGDVIEFLPAKAK